VLQQPKLSKTEQPAEDPDVKFSVEGTADTGYVSDLIPDVAAKLAWGALVSKEAVEEEIDVMLTSVRGFWQMEPDQRMRLITAMSARCTELCVHLHRLEGRREWRQVRTQQVERLLAELDRQFRIASREIEVRRQDIELTRGS
jgi:cytosine/adenosine deaminase-related metal-dependent hydrolase